MGDLNARTGRLDDYILDDSVDHIPHPDYYEVDNFRKRLNKDENINSYGKKLIDLCLSTDLKIANGRTIGDLYGNFTCHSYNGSSLVDYILVQTRLFVKIQFLKVHSISHLSDHCPLSFSISLQNEIKNDSITKDLNQFPIKYMWESSSTEKYQEAIQSAAIRSKITQYLHMSYDTDDAVQGLNDIIYNAADMSLKTCSNILVSRKQRPKKKTNEKWFDKPCYIMKREFQGMSKLLVKHPRDPYVRARFFQLKKEYKKIIKLKRRSYKEALLNELNQNEKKDPAKFWKTITELKTDNSLPTSNGISNSISVDAWIKHFSNLNKECKNDSSLDADIGNLENTENNVELNKEITSDEITKAIRQLKKKKSPGKDKILNEMIIYGQTVLNKPIKKLFNIILNTGKFPDIWRSSIIKPIYKSGDKNNPSNYRGIALSSCLSKLFTSVINNRLHIYVEQNNILNPCQAGFRPGYRTTDNMFILKTIIDKYINNKNNTNQANQTNGKLNKVFVGFVDFRKAFDSIWRKGLYYKLLKNKINGKIYNVIKNMYNDVKYSIKLNNGLTNDFKSLRGVRQGCNISPMLFNLFMNDLPSELDESCKPVKLNDISIGSLLYADDLVFISETESGLQNCFNKLSEYCSKWNLEVNTTKTKIMIFNKSGKLLNHKFIFHYKNEELDIVRNYKYLGIEFKPSGNFDLAKENLYKKALKTFFYIRKLITTSTNISIPTWINIFDHVIRPILTYGCEIWGSEKYTDRSYPEMLNLKMSKMLLQVNQTSTNLAVRGELGRQPISVFINKMMIRYWHNIFNNKKRTLINDAITCNISNQLKWAKSVQDIIGGEINEFWSRGEKNIQQISSQIEKNYIELWKKQITSEKSSSGENNKLRTYCKFKNEFKMEHYLTQIKDPL